MLTEVAQKYGLWLKLLLAHLRKFPAGRTTAELRDEFPISRVGNNLGAILELALAAELIEECYNGNTIYYKILIN